MKQFEDCLWSAMESLVLGSLLCGYIIGFCMMVSAFLLWKRNPHALWLMRTGAYLAVAVTVFFVAVPGIVPWWEYDASSYWTRTLAVVIPILLTFVLLHRHKAEKDAE